MASSLSRGERLFYITGEGMKSSLIVNVMNLNNKTFFQLENGEFAVETNLGIVRAMLNDEILRTFGIVKNESAGQNREGKPI